jgi:pimeloyl-ACP methyl ester carboxylesterase
MERWLITLGLALLASAAVLVAAGYLATMGVVGHFAPSFRAVPADYGLKAEVISFQSVDGIDLKGWWIPTDQGAARGTVILAHGNGGNRSSMVSRAPFLVANGYNAFLIDLRAHGESAGNYGTPGYLEALDILGAVEAAKRRGQEGPFVALGHSYGARASLWAAARSKDLAAVVADSAFISIYDALKREVARVGSDPGASFGEKIGLRMANRLSESSWARSFMEWAYHLRTGVRFDVQSDDAMRAVAQIGERPILFIVGEGDRIAPPEDARRMYGAAQSPMKAMLVVPGADHNSTFKADPDLDKAKVLDFLDIVLRPRAR